MTIVGQDASFDFFDAPSTGDTLVTFVNQGSMAQSMHLYQLNDGVSFEQIATLLDAMNAGDPDAAAAFLELVTDIGGVDGVAPGDNQQLLLSITPGNYVAFDLNAAGQDMVALFTVTPPDSAVVPAGDGGAI